MFAIEKWDLIGAMAKASEGKFGGAIFGTDFSVTVSAIYRDGDDRWYSSRASLIYIRAQRRLEFGPTTRQETAPPKSSPSASREPHEVADCRPQEKQTVPPVVPEVELANGPTGMYERLLNDVRVRLFRKQISPEEALKELRETAKDERHPVGFRARILEELAATEPPAPDEDSATAALREALRETSSEDLRRDAVGKILGRIMDTQALKDLYAAKRHEQRVRKLAKPWQAPETPRAELRSEWSETPIEQTYPAYRRHWTKKEVIVKDAAEDEKLGGGWAGLSTAFEPYEGPRVLPGTDQNVIKWVADWAVPGVSGNLRARIEAALLRADSSFWTAPDLEGADLAAMKLAFDGVAKVLFDSGILTGELLRNEIPLLVWDSAIAGGWYRFASETPARIFPEQLGHYHVWRDEAKDWNGLFRAETAKWLAVLREASTEPPATAATPTAVTEAPPSSDDVVNSPQATATDVPSVKEGEPRTPDSGSGSFSDREKRHADMNAVYARYLGKDTLGAARQEELIRESRAWAEVEVDGFVAEGRDLEAIKKRVVKKTFDEFVPRHRYRSDFDLGYEEFARALWDEGGPSLDDLAKAAVQGRAHNAIESERVRAAKDKVESLPPPEGPKAALVAERASQRRRIVMPILEKRGWTRSKLVTKSGVGKGTVYEYLDGTREWISFENGEALADTLGLAVADLPDVRPKE